MISLRPFEIEDSDLIKKWRFDIENYNFFYEFVPISSFINKLWMESALKKTKEINFIVFAKNIKKDIGMISLLDIDYRNQKCEVGRVLIGEKEFRGNGFGRSILNLCIDYAFNHLNMQKIYIEVFSDNLPAIKLYKSCGFIEDGHFYKHIYKNGDFKDVIHLSCFKNDKS